MSTLIDKEIYTDEEVEKLAKEFLNIKESLRSKICSFDYYTFLRRNLTVFEIIKLCPNSSTAFNAF